MTAILTYHLRSGCLSTMASGKIFYLPTYQEPSRVTGWEKVQEIRSGSYTLWDHCFELPHQPLGSSISSNLPLGKIIHRFNPSSAGKFELFDYPGDYPLKFDGEDEVSSMQHIHLGAAIYIRDQRSGIYIHGLPLCNLKHCVVVMHQWEEVMQAIVREPELSFSIVY
jgi:hypothetical protein